MKRFFVMALVLAFVFSCPGISYSQDKWENLLIESARVFEDMTKMPDEGIPSSILEKAYAVAIFPSTLQGGFVFGAKYGQGVIVAKDYNTGKWSEPAVFNIAGGSFGWQIGGEAIDIILVVMSERGLDGLLRSKFKLGGDASIAAGPVGRSAEAATDLQLKGGILSYSRSRGLFIGLKLEGAVVSYNRGGSESLYGDGITARDILIKGDVKHSEYADRLLNDMSKY